MFYGLADLKLYSGRERNFNDLPVNQFREELLVKGDIETVTRYLGSKSINNEILNIRLSKSTRWDYYMLPLEYHEDETEMKYCIFAVSRPEDISAVKALQKSRPVPRDPNAPRFEFRGIVTKMSLELRKLITDQLWDIYDDWDVDIYTHANVNKYIVPYTIYVRTGMEGGLITVIIGVALMAAGTVLLAVLWVKTNRKKNMY